MNQVREGGAGGEMLLQLQALSKRELNRLQDTQGVHGWLSPTVQPQVKQPTSLTSYPIAREHVTGQLCSQGSRGRDEDQAFSQGCIVLLFNYQLPAQSEMHASCDRDRKQG